MNHFEKRLTDAINIHNELNKQYIGLVKENKKLKEGLEFYADYDNWVYADLIKTGCDSEDGTTIARQTLKEIDEENPK